MNRKYIVYDILKSLAITILTIWLIWSIPHDAGLGSLAYAGFITYGIPGLGIVLLILNFLKLRKLENVNKRATLLISFLLLVIVPLPLGVFTSTSISSAERNYYSSNSFIEDYGDKHGLHAEITNRTASFAQCSLIEYSANFRITANSNSVLVFDAQNITDLDRKTGFVDNLEIALGSQFEPKQGLDVHGLAYTVPEGSYNLKVTSGEPFVLTITDSKKLILTETLSGKKVYAPILQDNMTYQQFIDQVQDTKNNTCQGTAREYGSYWFANEFIVVSDVGITQDETHTKLYLGGYTPKLHFATIITKPGSYNPKIDDNSVIKPYKTIINKYTGHEIPVLTSEKFEQQRQGRLGTIINQMIEQNAIFPEPLRFADVEIFFEPIERFRADEVIKVVENIEPAFYEEISF